MRIPIPEIQRQQLAGPSGGGPLASPVGTGGLQDLARTATAVGMQARDQADREQAEMQRVERIRLQNAERIDHEAKKARTVERASSARLEWTEAFMRRQAAAPADAADFAPSTIREFDAWQTKSLEAVQDPVERDMLKGMLLPLREHLGIEALKFQSTRALAHRKQTILDGTDVDARTVAADPSQFMQVLALRDAAIRSSTDIPEADRSALAQQARETLAWQAGSVLVAKDPAGWLKREPGKDPIATSLDPEKYRQLNERARTQVAHEKAQAQAEAERRARKSEADAERHMRKAEAEFNVFQSLADKGTAMDPAYIERTVRLTAGTPYADGVRALAKQAGEAGGIAAQSVANQRAMLDAIDAQIATQGRSPALDARREQVRKVLDGTEGDLRRDPLRAALERGVITALTPINMQGGIPGLLQQLAPRTEQADRVRQWGGAPVSPLTGQEAEQVARTLSAMPADQKAAAVSSLSSAMRPEQAQALAKQIDAQDRPLSLALAMGSSRTTSGRTTAELVLRGAQAVKDKSIKEERGAEFGTRALIAKEVGEVLAGQAREDVIDAARLIYIGKQAAGETVSERGAVALALGGPIVEHNGRRLPVPADMDADMLRRKLATLPATKINAQQVMAGGRTMTVPEFLAVLPDAQLEPAGQGRYVVRTGGQLVMNEQRRPVVVDVR